MRDPRVLDNLATSPLLWRSALLAPRCFPGHLLHQAALWAIHERAFPRAERLFEAAAAAYRRELDLVPLARLRVHQLMARVLGTPPDRREAERALEVERRLCRLDRIESLTPPFDLVEASSLLANWLSDLTDDSSAGRAPPDGSLFPATRAA